MIDFFGYDNELDKYDQVSSVLIKGNVNISSPYFSIIIPTYNRLCELYYSIKSALCQEFDDYEVIVLENGISEKTNYCAKIISEFKDERLLYYRNEENIGTIGNWNRASTIARGKYVVMLHDDDMLDRTYLKVVYDTIRECGDVELIGTDNRKFQGSEGFDFDLENVKIRSKRIKYRKLTIDDVFFGQYIGIVGMTYKRESFIQYGGFKEWCANPDTVFIANMANTNKAYYIKANYYLTAYRHGINESLKEGALEKLTVHMHMLREQMAGKTLLMSIGWSGERQHLVSYIKGGEKYWGKRMASDKIYKMCGYSDMRVTFMDKIYYRIALLIYKTRKYFISIWAYVKI